MLPSVETQMTMEGMYLEMVITGKSSENSDLAEDEHAVHHDAAPTPGNE